ncbi:MAG: DUF11 domain-containing protein [Phycisphaeraceae bacterium]|nr:DUF11 domain-containing protein [Phycisphaeraceae bacterium]
MRKLKHVALAAAAGLATAADAQVIAGADNATAAGIWGYDLSTGTWTQLALNQGAATAPWGLAADDVNRRLYSLSGSTLAYFPYGAAPGTLDPAVTLGTITNGPGGPALNGTGLAYNPTTGLLYMIRNIATEAVYSIDPATLVATTEYVYDSAFDLGGFDYNPDDGMFYGTNDATGPAGRGLYRINIGAGTVTFITPYQGLPGENNDIDGLGVGGGKAYYIIDQPGENSVWNFATNAYETPITSPFVGSYTFSGGAYAAGLYGPPPQFDASISLVASPTVLYSLGANIVYTLNIFNNGSDPVTGTTVTVNLAPEVDYVSDTGGGSHAGGVVTVPLGILGGGSGTSFTITTVASSTGLALTSAAVTINEPDALPGNNASSATVEIVDASGLPPLDVIYSEVPTSPTSDVPGRPGQKFTLFERPYRSPDGTRWVITGLTNAGTLADEFIIVGSGTSGQTLLMENDPAPWLPGVLVDEFDREIAISNNGAVIFNGDTDENTSLDEYVIRYDGSSFAVLAQESVTLVPGFFDEFYGLMTVASSNGDLPAILTTATIGALPATQDDFLIINGVVVAQVGVTIPGNQFDGGSATWQFFDAGDFRVNADGTRWLAQGDTDANTLLDDILVVNGNVVIQEGFPVDPDLFIEPVTNIVEPYMASNGDWMARGTNAGTGTDWVVLNGTVIAVTGDDIGIGTGETWGNSTFADTFFFMCADNNGNVVIGGVTSNTDVRRDAILLLICADGTKTELARQGNPVDLDGNGFFDDGFFINIFNNDDGFLTDDGWLYFTADMSSQPGGGTDLGQAFMRIRTPGCGGGCPADLSGASDPNDPAYGIPDGVVDASDFFYYLDQFVAGNLAVADLTGSSDPNDPAYGVPDGQIDASDFFYFLDIFVAGCP